MKRLVLTLAISLAFALGGVAQQLSFDFEDGTLQGWTTLDGDGDGHCWEPSIGGMGHNSNGMVMAYSKDYATGEPLTPNEYLVSPRLVLNEWPVIKFFVCALDEIYCAEHFGVSISTTVNDDPLAFTLLHEWTLTAKDAGNRQGNWYEFTVDLSAYTGQEVYVAIRHFNCTDMFAICVDDIQIDGTIQQDGLVISPDILTFEEPWVPQTFTISNQTDNVVTISSINVEPDDNVVLLSGQGLPRTLQPNETMNVEVYVNGIGYKGYLTYYVNVATSIGYRQVTVRVNEEAWDEGLLWMPMQGLTFDENSPLTQGFNLTNTNALESITIYELYEDGTNYLELVPSHSLPYVIPPHESLYIDVTLVNFPENTTNVNIYSSSSLGQGSSPYVHIAGGLSIPYHPIVEDGKQWNVLFSYPWTPPEPQHKYTDIYKIEGDTLVDGVSYKVMYTTRNEDLTGWSVCGVIRETEDRQVLYRRDGSSYDEILYDFSMEVGDTIIMNGSGFYPDWMFVVETNEILINGEPRKQIVLEYSWGDREVWIEGIGSLYGIIDSGSLFLTGGSTNLLCYYEDGDLIWQNTTPGYDECYMVYPTPPTPPEPHHFAPLGAEWYFHVWSQGPITEPPFYYIRHAVTGEAEVQGHLCSVIDGYRYVYEEDGVVYMYNHSTDAFTVMYDFNAEEGDTWYCDIEEGFTCLVTVESVDSVTWNGHTYRTQYVTGYIPDEGFLIYDGRIIEGIGYEKGLFPHEFVYDGTEYAYMRCYLEDGELLYHEGDYDCDYVPGSQPQQPQFEWYYEIQNEDGSITYQYMYQAGDTIINDEPTHILVKINTLYDKGLRDEVTHEYVYERDGKLYWWNKTLEVFTVLYDYEAEVGDSWEIKVGTRTLDMHVDAVEEIEYEGRVWRMLRVSDPEDLFSGNIVCGIGHLTSFFPERLMDKGDGLRVEGMRCYWSEGELVFKYGDEDCDAVISELHGIEEDGPSTGSGTLLVYPNPTDGVLVIETHGRASLQGDTYRISNMMGQVLLQGQIMGETQRIDVSSLPQGMYFITVGEGTRKFVVNR